MEVYDSIFREKEEAVGESQDGADTTSQALGEAEGPDANS